jgi:epoxyqueuosine reductase
MTYLGEALDVRLEPGRVLDGARAFVVVADRYAPRGDEDDTRSGVGRVARYARGKNYHDVVKRRLHRVADAMRVRFPGSDFRTCVDTAPVPERELAALAGLGWIGKNTMLIHPRVGSYVVLGVMATTLDLAPATDQTPDHCGTCTRCIDACPTGAITPYSVDASRCVSYLTIERREVIPPALHRGVGDWIFGCDVCQEVCPHNSAREAGQEGASGGVNPAYAPARRGFDLLGVLGWTEEDRREAFRGSAMKRATLAIMKRNALVAAGNALERGDMPAHEATALRARIGAIAADDGEEDLVRSSARDVLARLEAWDARRPWP